MNEFLKIKHTASATNNATTVFNFKICVFLTIIQIRKKKRFRHHLVTIYDTGNHFE